MRVLVTGVAGFVGSQLADFLRGEHPEVEVYGLERLHGTAPEGMPAGVTTLRADLDDEKSVGAVVSGLRPDRVVHLAGQSSVQHSWIDPGGTLRTNVLGIVHLLEALGRDGHACRVLVVGSADEYGRVAPRDLPLVEDSPLRPASPYAVSKAAQGLLALRYDGYGGLGVVVTRTFPHTGPRRGEAFAESSFARQLAEIAAGRRPPVVQVGNLEAVRDFSDVRDVVRAYWGLLEKGSAGEVYNVCSGTGYSLRQVMDLLVAAARVDVRVEVDPARLRPVDVPVLVGDPSKLRAATGWEPKIPLATTLADLLADWRQRIGPAPAGVRA